MQSLKRLVKRHLPALAAVITDRNAARYFERRYGALNREVRRRLYPDESVHVLAGPFAGMRYVEDAGWGSMGPKWIGCYESELNAPIEQLVAAAPAQLIDLGSAEGYYAVGLARRLPRTLVQAFDLSPRARRSLCRMIRLNRCDNVVVRGLCDPKTLGLLLASGKSSAVVCDIEGGELELLDPARTHALTDCLILVECHRVGDLSPADVAKNLAARFAASHEVETIHARDRRANHVLAYSPRLAGCPAAWLETVADEGRVEDQQWLWMRPRLAKK